MNDFPLHPFLVSLSSDGIRISIRDYDRIGLALQTGGKWTMIRLRDVLSSLLVKDEDQLDLFLRRFNGFFEAEPENPPFVKEDKRGFLKDYAEIDVHRALADFKNLTQEKRIESKLDKQKAEQPVFFRPEVQPSEISDYDKEPEHNQPEAKQPVFFRPEVQPSEISDYDKEPEHNQPEAKQPILFRPEIQPSEISDYDKEPDRTPPDFNIIDEEKALPLDNQIEPEPSTFDIKPPEWDKDGPRYFAMGEIGGKPAPRISDEVMTGLADSMGYFLSGLPGKKMDVPETIKKTVRRSGIPDIEFHRQKQIQALMILEDRLAQAAQWNPIAGELAAGIDNRGISVLHGFFAGSPEIFTTEDGLIHHLEDLEDKRKGFLVLIFTDGKWVCNPRQTFSIEALKRWPNVAWMELREPCFWDESTEIPVNKGIPLFPATSLGIAQAIRSFLTEQGAETDFSENAKQRKNVPAFSDQFTERYAEYLLGDAFIWAQDCALIQPISLGMADAIRQKFHKRLPPDRIERLFMLPGTMWNVAGISFSIEIMKALRQQLRRSEPEQEEVLRFIVEQIEKAEPHDKNCLAFLKWEIVKERICLEIKPDTSIIRLSRLAHPESPVQLAVRESFENFGFQGQTDKIPLRIRKDSLSEDLLKRLSEISKSFESDFDIKPKYNLRKTPLTVSSKEALSTTFKLDKYGKPLEYVKNDFRDNGNETITDYLTGLTWQKSGTTEYMDYWKEEAYIRELNQKKFGGYDDWRLPTVDELKSLITPEKQSNGLYINPIFINREKHNWYWTSDKLGLELLLFVSFDNGQVGWKDPYGNPSVRIRGVRSNNVDHLVS